MAAYINSRDYISLNKVALKLDISPLTIKNWYKWYEDENCDHGDLVLPPYYHFDGRRTKYFLRSDVPMLIKFRRRLQTTHRGVMADFNAVHQWGNRGKEILKRKEFEEDEQNAD